MSQKKDQRDYKSSISLSQIVELASLGIRQSPLGLMEILPTFGPSVSYTHLMAHAGVDASRWSLDMALERASKINCDQTYVPMWGEKLVWKNGKLN